MLSSPNFANHTVGFFRPIGLEVRPPAVTDRLPTAQRLASLRKAQNRLLCMICGLVSAALVVWSALDTVLIGLTNAETARPDADGISKK